MVGVRVHAGVKFFNLFTGLMSQLLHVCMCMHLHVNKCSVLCKDNILDKNLSIRICAFLFCNLTKYLSWFFYPIHLFIAMYFFVF